MTDPELDKQITQCMQLHRLACVETIRTSNWMLDNAFGCFTDLFKYFAPKENKHAE